MAMYSKMQVAWANSLPNFKSPICSLVAWKCSSNSIWNTLYSSWHSCATRRCDTSFTGGHGYLKWLQLPVFKNCISELGEEMNSVSRDKPFNWWHVDHLGVSWIALSFLAILARSHLTITRTLKQFTYRLVLGVPWTESHPMTLIGRINIHNTEILKDWWKKYFGLSVK